MSSSNTINFFTCSSQFIQNWSLKKILSYWLKLDPKEHFWQFCLTQQSLGHPPACALIDSPLNIYSSNKYSSISLNVLLHWRCFCSDRLSQTVGVFWQPSPLFQHLASYLASHWLTVGTCWVLIGQKIWYKKERPKGLYEHFNPRNTNTWLH